jgi:hypothetical protein
MLKTLKTRLRSHKERATSEAAPDEEEDGAFNAANREYDPSLFAEVREGWVRRHMEARAADYTTRRPLVVSVSSWNVGGRKPPVADDVADGLAELLQVGRRADVLAIGLQERS